jgi:hypothetical protein
MCLPFARFVAVFAHHMKLEGYNIVDFTSQLADFSTVHRHLLKGSAGSDAIYRFV